MSSARRYLRVAAWAALTVLALGHAVIGAIDRDTFHVAMACFLFIAAQGVDPDSKGSP